MRVARCPKTWIPISPIVSAGPMPSSSNRNSVAVGRDVRQSSDDLFDALTRGLTDSGVDVLDLGLCGTEQVYFAAFHLELDGGIMITASHNPIDYNGFKFVRESARPLSGDSGLQDIRRIAEA